MTDKVAEPISYIMNSEVGGVLSKAFAELYRKKPNFPVTYLANWLKDYSHSQQSKKDQTDNLKKNIEQYHKLQQQSKNKSIHQTEKKHKLDQKLSNQQKQFNHTIQITQHLEDLLKKWLPNYIENKYQLSGAYVGNLTHPIKAVDPTNFQVGAQFDAESPKIIQYIGTSDSQQKTMFMKILPSQHGVSFQCFNEPEPQPQQAQPAEGQEPKPPKEPKKTYIFVPDVTKNEKMHFFKFPRLGSYACFPLKLKSILTQSSFDQGVIDYKQYTKQKQQTQKQYHDKINELRAQTDEAKKKYEQFQLPQQDPSPEQQAQKKSLEQQAHKAEQALTELQNNPPKVPQPNFNSIERNYLLGCDTLGQDKQISAETLDQIDKKMALFKKSFQKKERNMLLHDIHSYIEEQSKLESIQNIYKEHEKNAAAQAEQQAKQKGLKDKELELEIAATKAKKMDSIFQDPLVQKSMKTYFGYNTPKYKQVIQIALMLLGYKKEDINQHRKNTLNFRKIRNATFVQEFLKKLYSFDLKPQSAGACSQEYKINKLLQRLQKIDLEQVSKYNGFIWVLVNHLKSYCWALILCRDAKKQSYEQSLKAKQDRDAEIQKYKDERQKAMDAAKAELGQQIKQKFNDNQVEKEWEKQWISNYIVDSPQPQPLEVIKLQEYFNID